MTTVISAQGTRVSLLFMLYSFMFLFLFMLMVVRSPQNVRADIETELRQALVTLGVKDQNQLEDTTKARFQSWIYDSGFYPSIYAAIAPTRQREGLEEWQKKGSYGFLSEGWVWRLLENLQLYSYQITHRLTMLEFWVMTTLPMMICIILSGHYHRKIRQYQLIAASPAHVRVWLKTLWIVLFLFSIYLITPNIFGFYTLFAPPILLGVVALSIALILANFTKSL